MKLSVKTEPSVEPVSLDLAKVHLNATGTAQDALIESILIPTARQNCEEFIGRALINRTLQLYLDEFPRCSNRISLPYPPLVSVTSVKYYDESDALQTLSTDYYQVDAKGSDPAVQLKYGYTWPSTYLGKTNAVEIEFVCGYGEDVNKVPAPIRQAMLITIATLHEFREALISGTIIAEVPFSATELLNPFRVIRF